MTRGCDWLAIGILCSGCASVPFEVDGRRGEGRLKESSCNVAAGTQTVFVRAVDEPGFFELKLRTEITGKSEAPNPLVTEFQGLAEMTFDDQLNRRNFTGQAHWRAEGDRVCVRFSGAWLQGHIAESAPVGPDGKLQRTTEHPVELGPWCTAQCGPR